jgi:hypothetical protein
MDTPRKTTRRARSFSVAAFSSRDLWWAQRRPSGKYVIHCSGTSVYERGDRQDRRRADGA